MQKGVKKSLESQKDRTQGRKVAKVAKQTKRFLQAGLCALASLREAADFFTPSQPFRVRGATPVFSGQQTAKPRHPSPRRAALSLVAFAAVIALGAVSPSLAHPQTSPAVTFNEIAPILYKNCADCHHPGGSGPFSLLTYAEARNRAGQIAAVTARRYMPPWPPEPGYVRIAGERRLTDEQIRLSKNGLSRERLKATLPACPRHPPTMKAGSLASQTWW